ncbi:SAM-dependent methyltransferase [Streptomyces sp. NPDC049555]|uniref:SAM-dependent methyltransferase n=1 Tax=Streptomyces sp. NPDC049555 TaxID=3154930 RepID=UPI0034253E9A
MIPSYPPNLTPPSQPPPAPAPPGLESVSFSQPAASRVHDRLLGGKENYPADRALVERILGVDPLASSAAHAHLRHRQHVVDYLAARGFQQFVEIGCGYPHQPYVHEIAQQHGPVRVVYVDVDEVVIAHAAVRMAAEPPSRTVHVQADFAAGGLLADARVRRVVNLREPIAVLLHQVLHLIPGPVVPLLDDLKRALPVGSALSITHPTGDFHPRHVRAAWECTQAGMPVQLRSGGEVRYLTRGWELVEGGMVPTTCWPGRGPTKEDRLASGAHAVVAIKTSQEAS